MLRLPAPPPLRLLPPPPTPLDVLRQLVKLNGFEDPFLGFELVLKPPPNLKCLLLVAQNLFVSFRAMSAYWLDTDPFQRWDEMCLFLLDERKQLVQLAGEIVEFGLKTSSPKAFNPMFGDFGRFPFFAMMCDPLSKEADKHRGLQLQILHAHWRKIHEYLFNHRFHKGEVREGRPRYKGDHRHIKMPDFATRTVRALGNEKLTKWFEKIDTTVAPGNFMQELAAKRPPAGDLRYLHDWLMGYCRTGYRSKRGGGGGLRIRSIDKYLNNYSAEFFGLLCQGPGSDGDHTNDSDAQNEEHLVGRKVSGGDKNRLTAKELLGLGIDPLELAVEDPTVLTPVPGAGTRLEAIETARARIRGFEIDRRLFPWNSQAIRLEEFHCYLRPHLKEAANENGPSNFSAITAAAAVAIMGETGRNVEELLQLQLEETLTSAFAYRRPDPQDKCGQWKWDAIGPRYKSDDYGTGVPDGLAVRRAKFLIYPASAMVTALVERYLLHRPTVKDNRLFPLRLKWFRSTIKEWLKKYDPADRFSESRITHLAWDTLHQLTGGELASVCLTLGLHHPLAQVELFYSILETTKAAGLFAQSQARLWGEDSPSSAATPTGDLRRKPEFVGCKPFPRITAIRLTIRWLRRGSQAFFGLRLRGFNAAQHAEALNCAVMYVVWHQFFCFGTRAIRSAYQPKAGFSDVTGIGILSDKDYETGYKTRIIVAPERLRRHMEALENRLAELVQLQPELKLETDPPVWLLDENGKPVELTPTTIQSFMNKRFPFPVNTPRKVMRYLLREAGMSHSHAEAFMGHWWHGREPFAPFSSFDFRTLVASLDGIVRDLTKRKLRFYPVPGIRENERSGGHIR